MSDRGAGVGGPRGSNPPGSFAFPRHYRLTLARDFQSVYKGHAKTRLGPLVLHARPNALGHCRLGMAVGRRVGRAVDRGRIKRRLRDAFRHHQHEFPGDYDIVVNVRPHKPLRRDQYRDMLAQGLRRLHRLAMRE